jgi:hypothetical protein
VVPIAYYGFAWKSTDFCQLIAASEYPRSGLQVNYQSPGLGAGLIAVRKVVCEEPFHQIAQRVVP